MSLKNAEMPPAMRALLLKSLSWRPRRLRWVMLTAEGAKAGNWRFNQLTRVGGARKNIHLGEEITPIKNH